MRTGCDYGRIFRLQPFGEEGPGSGLVEFVAADFLINGGHDFARLRLGQLHQIYRLEFLPDFLGLRSVELLGGHLSLYTVLIGEAGDPEA